MSQFLPLPVSYLPNEHDVSGWYAYVVPARSRRCLWDAGITKDYPIEVVPWANLTNPKTGEAREFRNGSSSGFWSANLLPIHPPRRLQEVMPKYMVDGYLAPDPLRFEIISCPPIHRVFADRLVKNATIKVDIVEKDMSTFVAESDGELPFTLPVESTLTSEMFWLTGEPFNEYCYLAKHVILPNTMDLAKECVLDMIQSSENDLLLRNPKSFWTPGFSQNWLKVRKKNYENSPVS